MTDDQIIELAIQGHASTRDAIRWAIKQEREACAKIADSWKTNVVWENKMVATNLAKAIRARGQA